MSLVYLCFIQVGKDHKHDKTLLSIIKCSFVDKFKSETFSQIVSTSNQLICISGYICLCLCSWIVEKACLHIVQSQQTHDLGHRTYYNRISPIWKKCKVFYEAFEWIIFVAYIRGNTGQNEFGSLNYLFRVLSYFVYF